MLGAITGDTIGSRFEFAGTKRTDFDLFGPGCRYTDDGCQYCSGCIFVLCLLLGLLFFSTPFCQATTTYKDHYGNKVRA